MTEQQPSYPIGLRNNLLTAEHRRKLGNRIWELAWLVDRVTEEYMHDTGEVRGRVLGGVPIQAGQIADHYGMSKDSVLDSLDRLELAGYIVRVRTGRGYLIEVRNSCKWPHRFSGPNTSPPSTTGPPTDGESENRRLGVNTNSPVLVGGYPQPDGIYQQNPQPGGSESAGQSVGESEESPTLRTSDSPTPKDVAMGTDIASGNESNPPAAAAKAREGLSAEAAAFWESVDRAWGQAVARVSANVASPETRAAVGQCRMAWCLDGGSEFVAFLPSAPADRQRVKKLLPNLQRHLAAALGRPCILALTPPDSDEFQIEARAGP